MKPSLDIAFFGSSLVSAYWNGAATYYRGIIRYLALSGHRVTFYEPDAFERQQHRDMADPPWCRVVVYSGTDGGDVDRVLDAARRADVLVKASGVGVWDDVLDAGVLHAKRAGALALYWDVDAPATLERLNRNPSDPLRALVPRFDLVLTYGGGEPVVRGYLSLGAKRCVPVYNALDPDTHFPVGADPRFDATLALLANRLPDREARIDTFFFEPARALPGDRFLLGGNGWHDKAVPPNVVRLGHVYTADHNAFNASPKCILNVARDSMAAAGWSPATRVFEAAGAGACIVTDAWPGLEDFLEPGREVLVAQGGEDVARIVRDVDRQKARAIGVAARARVLREHTYPIRARQVEELLIRAQKAAPAASEVAP
ncbi:MAG: glycosyltransferase [Polyangiaceae bacterium]|nr:glycosyltransferase [Polyangiaceae bacterium]